MSNDVHQRGPQNRQLLLGTISFTVCFAAWGLISAFAPRFRQLLHLTATQTAFLVAVPVLLGALARIPMGMLTDRFGGRIVFTVLMFFVAIPVALVPFATGYQNLLVVGFLSGNCRLLVRGGCGFRVALVCHGETGQRARSLWPGKYRAIRRCVPGPVIAAAYGFRSVYWGLAVILLVWAVMFAVFGRNASETVRPKGLGEMLGVLGSEPLAWALAGFYFLTFGGFVAFSIYLPTLLRDQFGLRPADAGFRTAGFVVLATLCRPLGGWLADKIGGSRVLSWILPAVAGFGLSARRTLNVAFYCGGAGNSGVARHRQWRGVSARAPLFPSQRATVTGLVGAMGGMGGFFPPLLLGMFRDKLGVIWPGFLLLSVVACLLWWMNARVFLPNEEALAAKLPPELTRTADKVRAGAWATLWTCVLIAMIVLGSRNLQNFDPALVIYTFAIVFATWGVIYHYSVWIRKPPTLRLLAARMAAIQTARGPAQFRSSCKVGGDSPSCPEFHPPPFAAALGHAPTDFLGMPAGSCHHISPGVRLDSLHQCAQ